MRSISAPVGECEQMRRYQAIARERISFSCLLILARKIKVIEGCELILLKCITVAHDVSQLMEKREPEIIDPIVPKSESYDRRFPIEEHGCTIKEGSSSRPGVLRGPIRARAVWPSEPTFDCGAGRPRVTGEPEAAAPINPCGTHSLRARPAF